MRSLVIGTLMLAACGQADVEQTATAENEAAAPGDEVAVAQGPTFDSIGELSLPDNLDTELRGGRPAVPSEWKASFYTLSGGSSCTASMVGDRVLMTAAHCVPHKGVISLRKAGSEYRGTCEHAPEYGAGGTHARTADYALCAMDKTVPDVPAERVSTNANALKVGTQILLTGFGCTTNQGTGGNDGIYRIGDANVERLPSGQNNDIVANGPAGVCFGDSGGPAFLVGPGKSRVQISVNSRVENYGDSQNPDLGARSFLSSLTSPAGTKFLNDWSAKHQLKICGLHSDAATCRS